MRKPSLDSKRSYIIKLYFLLLPLINCLTEKTPKLWSLQMEKSAYMVVTSSGCKTVTNYRHHKFKNFMSAQLFCRIAAKHIWKWRHARYWWKAPHRHFQYLKHAHVGCWCVGAIAILNKVKWRCTCEGASDGVRNQAGSAFWTFVYWVVILRIWNFTHYWQYFIII